MTIIIVSVTERSMVQNVRDPNLAGHRRFHEVTEVVAHGSAVLRPILFVRVPRLPLSPRRVDEAVVEEEPRVVGRRQGQHGSPPPDMPGVVHAGTRRTVPTL